MKINLTKGEGSEVQVINFPDGQQDVKILNPQKIVNYIEDHLGDPYNVAIHITSRMNSFKDLELILCTVAALKRLGVERMTLKVPYILGARSDRQFVRGGTSYLVDVIAPLINSCNFIKVFSLDTHSDVAAACINNLVVEPNYKVVDAALRAFDLKSGNITVVSPDAGALKKIYNVMAYINKDDSEPCKLAVGMKNRNLANGKILSTDVMLPKDEEGVMSAPTVKYVIIDDICDGGRTFIELAKVLREKTYGCKVYLVVSHGIFSAGTDVLLEHLDGVFTTNSIRSTPDSARIKYQDVL